MGEFPDFKETLQAMMTYDLNKQKVDVPSAIEAPPRPTILSASTTVPTNPAKTKCTVCHKMFPKTLRKDGGGEFTSCFSCFAKARYARSATAGNPTPAQVKKAQAVILAASVAVKGSTSDSIIPPPTQRERDAINNFMELQHYSMTATTTPMDSITDNSTTGSFLLDSGSSLSVTNCIDDLISPILLPTPIPITGADGAVIHATHVGSTCLGTLIHFVPKSTVKLVSLGSLTASGYMVSTMKDRSIAITTPTGTALCTCPIQSNDTWIFPSHLMIRKFSPPTAVPTGISVTLGTTAFPFRVPLDGRHFTKKEVKRATLARQLHHFLRHPNFLETAAFSRIILISSATTST